MDSNPPCLKIEKVILGAEAKVCWAKIERIWCVSEVLGVLYGWNIRCNQGKG